MNLFNFNRFVNVARWDLTVNSKFYTRSVLLMVAIICSPVVLYYLYSMVTIDSYFFSPDVFDNVHKFSITIALIGCAYTVISSGYMFHNLLTKQGRINELTLPATNLERFLWHVVVIVLGVNVVYFVGVLCADLLHVIFRMMIPGAEIKSITYENFVNCYENWPEFGDYTFGVDLFFFLMVFSYIRSFCLFNALKYKYNIPLTFLFYFILQNVVTLLSIVVFFDVFDLPRGIETIWNWLNDGWHAQTILVCLNILAFLLYIGIWFLTYRFYTRAQLTTKRNP